jgi:hypothetical protein
LSTSNSENNQTKWEWSKFSPTLETWPSQFVAKGLLFRPVFTTTKFDFASRLMEARTLSWAYEVKHNTWQRSPAASTRGWKKTSKTLL